MTHVEQICQNNGMPRKPAPTLEPLPDIDIPKLCAVIARLKDYNQRQMAELLGVEYITYQSWQRKNENTRREPNVNAVGKLFYLRDQVEKELEIKIPLPLKNTLPK